MKKLLSIVLVLIMCLSFAACGDEGGINQDSGKYIPGGVCLGMNADEIKEARSESSVGVVESDFATKNYGHTVLGEILFGKAVKEYFDASDMDWDVDPSIDYHLNGDGKLYSVEVHISFDSSSDYQDALDAVVGKYVEVVGEEPEITEETKNNAYADWQTDSAKIRVEVYGTGPYGGSINSWYINILVTDPGSDHPEYQ
ncbi:MAG: hypothetical protein IKL62_02995 [Clostridia bacterium]|nr:hypothetical protein [Clostridia bacterium]